MQQREQQPIDAFDMVSCTERSSLSHFYGPEKVQRNQPSVNFFCDRKSLKSLFLGIIHDHDSINENVVQLTVGLGRIITAVRAHLGDNEKCEISQMAVFLFN